MAKIVIVTGGAGGIGSEICRCLAADGLKVVVADFDAEGANRTAQEIGNNKGEAFPVRVDVGSGDSVHQLMDRTLEKYRQIDFLVNGAGIMPRTLVQDMSEEEWDRVLRVNLKGTFLCSQGAARHMIPKKEGRILSIASGRGVAGQARASHYAASKAGVIAFTKSLAMELAPYNINVNAIAPGATDTPMSRAGFSQEEWQKREAVPPLMGGLTKKEEIVGLLRYFLSEPTKYITGQVFFLRTP